MESIERKPVTSLRPLVLTWLALVALTLVSPQLGDGLGGQEVMQLIVAGRLNKQIAEELDISIKTVEVHRSRVLDKMGVKSAVELAGLLGRRERQGEA